MGRHRINRPRRQIGFYVDQSLYDRMEHIMQRTGVRTLSEFCERGLASYCRQFDNLGIDEELALRPRPGKINLAIGDDIPVEDEPTITALVPEEEATKLVDESPRTFDPTKESFMDYIKGKRS